MSELHTPRFCTTLQTHQETAARAENIHQAESGANIDKVLCLILLCVSHVKVVPNVLHIEWSEPFWDVLIVESVPAMLIVESVLTTLIIESMLTDLNRIKVCVVNRDPPLSDISNVKK